MWEEFLKKHNIRGSEKERFFDEVIMLERRWIRKYPQCAYGGEMTPKLEEEKEQEIKRMLKDFLRAHHQMMGMYRMDKILKERYGQKFQSEVMDKFSSKVIRDDDFDFSRKDMNYIVDKVEQLAKTESQENMRDFLLSLDAVSVLENRYKIKNEKWKRKWQAMKEGKMDLKDIDETGLKEGKSNKQSNPLCSRKREHMYRDSHSSANKWERFKEESKPKKRQSSPSDEPRTKRARTDDHFQDNSSSSNPIRSK